MALGKDCIDFIRMGLWVGQKFKTHSEPLFFPELCWCFYLVKCAVTVNAFYTCRQIILSSPGFEADVRTSVDTVGESVDHWFLILEVLREVTIESGLVSTV